MNALVNPNRKVNQQADAIKGCGDFAQPRKILQEFYMAQQRPASRPAAASLAARIKDSSMSGSTRASSVKRIL